ncbi:MAG: hypothetical protein K6F14_01920 [Clostridiales bacterium]|nr:hypothetical protein [Clostridiales bacterium]
MSKNKGKVIPALLFAAVLCISVLAPVKTYASTPVYVALGDSIPAGYGLSSTKDAYPSLLSNEIRYTLYNLSHSGDTTSDLITKLKTSNAKSRLSQATLVTISIGGNDLIGSLENVFTLLYGSSDVVDEIYANSIANLRTICSTVISLVPKNCIILFENVYNPYGNLGLGSLIGQRIQRENQQIKTVCDENPRIYYVDVTSMNSNPDNFNAGNGSTLSEILDCHPTKAGHRVLADLMKDAFYDAGGKDNLPVTTQPITNVPTITETTKLETQAIYTTIHVPTEFTTFTAIESINETTSEIVTEQTTIEVTTEQTTTETTTPETTTIIQYVTTEKETVVTTIIESTRVTETETTQEQTTILETTIPLSTETSKETTKETSAKQTNETLTEKINQSETEENQQKGKTNVVVVILCLVGGVAVLVGAYFLMYNIFKYILMKRKD